MQYYAQATNGTLTKIAQQVAKDSYHAEANPTEEECLGVALARHFGWDGTAILQVAFSALEDANFHAEARKVEEMLKEFADKFPEDSQQEDEESHRKHLAGLTVVGEKDVQLESGAVVHTEIHLDDLAPDIQFRAQLTRGKVTGAVQRILEEYIVELAERVADELHLNLNAGEAPF